MVNFQQYANAEHSEEEKNEINARLEKRSFPLGDTDVSLSMFQPEKEGSLFRVSPYEDCVLEYRPIFKNIEGAQQAYFWKIALNWSVALKNDKIGFAVQNCYRELKELGIDPFNLSKALALTQGTAIEKLVGLNAVIRRDWSPNKFHLQFFKDENCYKIVDYVGNLLCKTSYTLPPQGSTRDDFRHFHAEVESEVFSIIAKKYSYEAMPSVKLLKLESANNESINKMISEIIDKKKGKIFPTKTAAAKSLKDYMDEEAERERAKNDIPF